MKKAYSGTRMVHHILYFLLLLAAAMVILVPIVAVNLPVCMLMIVPFIAVYSKCLSGYLAVSLTVCKIE